MRNLRKFSVFLLFIAVFGVLLYSLFPAALGDMAENLRSGGGTRTFIQAVQGADGVAYALEAEPGGGYTLYGTSQEGRVSARPLSQGLPQDFTVEHIHVAKNGCILLGIYERAGMELTRYALYAALPEQPFQLLLEAPLSGSTSDQRRASAGILYTAAAGELVELAVLQEGEYAAYTFDPAQGQGLVAAGVLTEEEAQEAQAANGAALEQARQAVSLAGLPGASVAWLAPTQDGGALALLYESGQMLLSVSPVGKYVDLSEGLYRIPWQSGLVLALLVAGVLFLSYGFYYLVCEYQKLYFPLVVKNLLWLGLAGYVAVSGVLLFAVGPRYRAGAEGNILAGLEAQAAQVTAQDETGLTQAAQALAQADEDYVDCTFLALGQGEDLSLIHISEPTRP